MIEHWLNLVEMYLSHKTALAALVAGFGISWVVTQIWKKDSALDHLTDAQLRWFTRLIAFFTGFLPVVALWPLPGAPRWVFAIFVGLSSPIAYTITMRIAGRYFPWLEGKVSARPDGQGNDFHREN